MAAEKPAPITGKLRHTTAWGVVGVLLLFTLVLLPFALTSVIGDVNSQREQVYRIGERTTPPGEPYADLRLELVSINEWDGSASIRVSVHQSCNRGCTWSDRFLIVSIFGSQGETGDLRPSSATVTLQATERDVTQTITLPIYGDPIRYPFDRYRLGVGIIADRVRPDGTVRTLDAAEGRAYLDFEVGGRLPRIRAERPEVVDPGTVQGDEDVEPYVYAMVITFKRPLYLQVLTILLVLLVTAAAAFAVFMRPLDQLIINSGALVLGVWGIRSILLGTGVPGVTAVDLALIVVILFLLVAITIRTLYLLEDQSYFRLLHRKAAAAAAATPAAAPPLADQVPAERAEGGS